MCGRGVAQAWQQRGNAATVAAKKRPTKLMFGARPNACSSLGVSTCVRPWAPDGWHDRVP
eukprot:5114873-Alexandrium_andersonii.AAC.1